MHVQTFETKEEWLAAREGRITGSTAKDIISVGGPTKEAIMAVLEERKVEFKKADKKEVLEALLTPEDKALLISRLPKKIGFYRLVAARLGLKDDGSETPIERGSRLEAEAVEAFEKETGKKLKATLCIWSRDEESDISVSPDAEVEGEDAAVEFKCLGSAYHIKAWEEKAIPDDYWFQVLQYFIVNDKLKTLYFGFYDPRIPSKPFFYITVTREQVQADVDMYLAYEKQELAQVRDIVNKLTF